MTSQSRNQKFGKLKWALLFLLFVFPISTFAATVTWPANYGPGDTVIFSGTQTSVFTVTNSGTAANPITISGGVFITTLWPASGAINVNTRDYITITNCSGANTANGSELANQAQSCGIVAVQANHLTIINCTFTNFYKRTQITDWNRMGGSIDITDGSFILVKGCYLTDSETVLSYTYGTGQHTNVTMDGNTILRGNHTINVGTASVNAFLRDLTISSNRIDGLVTWDSILFLGSPLHLDGIILFNEAKVSGVNVESGCMSNVVICGNNIGKAIGANNTAAIFFDVYYLSTFVGVKVFNNLFTTTNYWQNGFINLHCTDGLVANNTMIGYLQPDPSQGGTGTALKIGSGVHAYNNMFDMTGAEISLATSDQVGFDADYNLYNRFYNGGSGAFIKPNGQQLNINEWFAYITPLDTHSTWPYPFRSDVLDANYAPLPGSTNGIGIAANLTSLGITNDFNGVARPASGPWTIGAFEISTTNVTANFTGTPLVGLAPLSLTFTDVSANATNWSWTFGDAGTSTSQNPSHSYAAAGTYTVALTIIGLGQSDTKTRTSYVTATNAPGGGGSGSTTGGYAPFRN